MKVTKSYWSGLFHCYTSPDIPRASDDLEHLFGSHRDYERRASGGKQGSPGLVVRGSVRVVASLATRLCPEEGLNLPTGYADDWRRLHADLDKRRESRRKQHRFRHDPASYLNEAEERCLNGKFAVLEKNAGGAGGRNGEAPGRGRGGFAAEARVGVSGPGPPVRVVPTPGQAADVRPAEADRARGAEAVIAPLRRREGRRPDDEGRDEGRGLAERPRGEAEQRRRAATRCEKTARDFPAFARVASALALLR